MQNDHFWFPPVAQKRRVFKISTVVHAFSLLVSYVVDLNASTNDIKILNHSFDGTFQKL